jgi:ABC-2 type transport system permease protein
VNGRRILADFTVYARGYLRNTFGLFFSLIFPIILISIFGLIFANAGNAHADLYVQNLDGPSPAASSFFSALNRTGVLTLHFVAPSVGNLSTYLRHNQYAEGLVIPSGFARALQSKSPTSVVVYTDPADASGSGEVQGAVRGVIDGFNLRLAGGRAVVVSTTLTVASPTFAYIDYLVPGLIGFAILTSPMFSMVDVTSTYRKEKLFRQLSLTPLTKSEWLAAKILWYIVLTFVAAAVMLAVGIAVFGAHVTLTWGVLPFLVLGPLLFVSLGMLAGSVAANPESAAVLGNIITFPMMFLSGTFFPVSNFSPPLQAVARVLPLYYVIDGMNAVMLYGNVNRALLDAVIVLVLAVVVFAAAVVAFRWRDE